MPATGDYLLTWTYTEADQRDMVLEVNCVAAVDPILFANTLSWNSLWTDIGRHASLTRGVNSIRLRTNGRSGPNFDKMTITPPVCRLSEIGSVDCQAEEALMSGATRLATSGGGWTGTGFAEFVGAADAVNWVLDAPETGVYKLTFFHHQDGTGELNLKVNGVSAATSLALGDSGAWAGDVSVEVSLLTGLNSLQLSVKDGRGGSLDKVVVESLSGHGGAGGAE